MTKTQATNEIISRGIIKPTPVRGRYRYTSLGIKVLKDKSEYLSYARVEILTAMTTLEGDSYSLIPEIQELPVIISFKTVSDARKMGYVFPRTAITHCARTPGSSTISPRRKLSSGVKRQSFVGWRYTVSGDNLIASDYSKLSKIASEGKIIEDCPPYRISFSFSTIFPGGPIFQKLGGIQVSREANVIIRIQSMYYVPAEKKDRT
jgi:hypothetical protein